MKFLFQLKQIEVEKQNKKLNNLNKAIKINEKFIQKIEECENEKQIKATKNKFEMELEQIHIEIRKK